MWPTLCPAVEIDPRDEGGYGWTKVSIFRATVLVCAAFWALAASTAAEAKRVAFVVGINVYDNLTPNQQLLKAVNDSKAVAAVLKDIGFQVIAAENTTRPNFLRAWQRFLDTVAPGDVTALYFSGHGVEISGSNYLLVRDAPLAGDGEEVLKNSALRLQALMDRLKEQRAQVSIFIIDACRDNPYADPRGKRGLNVARGLRPEEPPKGTMIMLSAGAGQEALDALSANDPNPNSVYTRTLLPLLKEPGLEITDLAKRLRGEVEALAATVRHEQRPAFYHELSGDLFLVPKPVGSPAIASGLPATSEAAVAWSATKDTTSPAVLESFLKQFAATVYADMARARLGELKRTQVAVAAPAGATPATSAPPASVPRVDPPPVAASPSPARPAPVASPEPKQPEPRLEPKRAPSVYDAAQAWAVMRETNDLDALNDFIGKYADTIYGPMARQRLQELKGSQSTQTAAAALPAPPPRALDTGAPPAPLPPSQRVTPPASMAAVGVVHAPHAIAPLSAAEERRLMPQDQFTECAGCPEMTVVPAGSFLIGSPAGEAGRAVDEGPQVGVTFARPFAVGKSAVTFEEWDASAAGGGCSGYRPPDDGRPRGRYPVVNVSWDDAQNYVDWLSRKTGKPYRLLSEAEREYAARAGTTTPFWWGSSISSRQANYDGTIGYAGGERGEFRQRPLAVDSFPANPFGLSEVHGNVSEWVADCWRGSYQDMPGNGAATTTGDCGRRVLRGGSWYDPPQQLRAAARSAIYPGFRSNKIGFRVARSLAAEEPAGR
jgi:formylglycine-generating enzyme required for sulfatase activity